MVPAHVVCVFTLYTPGVRVYVAVWLNWVGVRVKPCHGAWWVRACPQSSWQSFSHAHFTAWNTLRAMHMRKPIRDGHGLNVTQAHSRKSPSQPQIPCFSSFLNKSKYCIRRWAARYRLMEISSVEFATVLSLEKESLQDQESIHVSTDTHDQVFKQFNNLWN